MTGLGYAFVAPMAIGSVLQHHRYPQGVSPCSRSARVPLFPSCILQSPPRRDSPTVPNRNEAKSPVSPVRPRKAPELHAGCDSIASTPVQMALVAAFGCLTLAELAKIITETGSPAQAGGVLAALVGGWLFADFGTAFYHWAVDNYGSESTPIFGFQIAAFQGHHVSPWTITNRDFANNLYRLTKPTIPQMALLLAVPLPPEVAAGLCSALFWIVASQELHKQAHMPRPHLYARFLQKAGIAVSRKEHGLHHSSPFEGKYAIVSGVFNPLLDNSLVFRRLEAFIYRLNGVEPIAWSLDPELKEMSLKL